MTKTYYDIEAVSKLLDEVCLKVNFSEISRDINLSFNRN